MLEFLLAFFPLLMLFFCILELSRLAIAELMLERAAGIGARACAVIKDQPLHCDSNANSDEASEAEPSSVPGESHGSQNQEGQDEQIRLATEQALRPLQQETLELDPGQTHCLVEGGAHAADENDVATDIMEVVAHYRCALPLARDIICRTVSISPDGVRKQFRRLTAEARQAHQGARYDCKYAH